MLTSQPRWQLASTGAATSAWLLAHRPTWRSALHALRAPVWPTVIAVLVGLGLLLTFQIVVSRSVVHAEQRHSASATRAEGTWRCKLLRSAGDRISCLAQLAGVQDANLP